MGLRDIGATLPPGFRFYPSDEELVCHYLHKKIANEEALKGTLMEIDLHTCEPWQLPEVAKLNTTEWYFFSFRDRKYATGFRTNRATISGYWKATGKDRVILDPKTQDIVGMRKTLVFYRNRAPNGIKTGWIMHEFRLESPHMPPKEDWVLCRVFHKSKGENNNQSQHMFDHHNTLNTSSPPPLIASPPSTNHHYHTNLCECQQPNSLISSNNPPFPQKPLVSHNITNKINDPNHNHNGCDNNNLMSLTPFSDLINSSAKNDDDYGFLWDMDLEETSKFGEGGVHVPPLVPQHEFGDVRFEDDSGMVFV